MGEAVLGTILVDRDEDGSFWLSMEGQESLGRRGPFETEAEAGQAAHAFINFILEGLVSSTLTGD